MPTKLTAPVGGVPHDTTYYEPTRRYDAWAENLFPVCIFISHTESAAPQSAALVLLHGQVLNTIVRYLH